MFKLSRDAQNQSPLVQLPAELRIPILEFLLRHDKPLTCLPGEPRDGERPKTSALYDDETNLKANYDFTPAILQTCQILHGDGTPILYQENELSITLVFDRFTGDFSDENPNNVVRQACYILDGSVKLLRDFECFDSNMDLFEHAEELLNPRHHKWNLRGRRRERRRKKWECFDSDGNRPMRTERLLALQPAIGRFPRLRVVLEFKRRPFFLPVWFPGGVPVESLGERCFSSANAFLYLRNLVRGKEVTLVPIMANVNPQTEGLIGGRIQNPEVWDFEELAGVRWWRCADLEIIRPGLDQADIARAVQVVTKSSQGEWEDLVMHYLRIEMGIDWMITRNGPNFNHDRLIKAALLFLRHRAVHYVDGAYRSFRDTLEGEIRRCWADWHSTAEDTSEFGESVLEDYIKRLWDGEPHENELLYEHIRETEG